MLLDRAELIELAKELIGTDYDLEVVVKTFDRGWVIEDDEQYWQNIAAIRQQLRRELRVYQDDYLEWRQAPRRKVAAA